MQAGEFGPGFFQSPAVILEGNEQTHRPPEKGDSTERSDRRIERRSDDSQHSEYGRMRKRPDQGPEPIFELEQRFPVRVVGVHEKYAAVPHMPRHCRKGGGGIGRVLNHAMTINDVELPRSKWQPVQVGSHHQQIFPQFRRDRVEVHDPDRLAAG